VAQPDAILRFVIVTVGGLLVLGSLAGIADGVLTAYGHSWIVDRRDAVLGTAVLGVLALACWLLTPLPSIVGALMPVLLLVVGVVALGLGVRSLASASMGALAGAGLTSALAVETIARLHATSYASSWPVACTLVATAIGFVGGYFVGEVLTRTGVRVRGANTRTIVGELVTTAWRGSLRAGGEFATRITKQLAIVFVASFAGLVVSAYMRSLDGMQIGAVGLGAAILLVVVLFVTLLAFSLSLNLARILADTLLLAMAFSDAVRSCAFTLARPVLVRIRFRKAICDTCLRWSEPLASTYSEGVRTCEKCGGVITFEGGCGRVVATFEETERPAPSRVFIRRAADIVEAEQPVDVTHLYVHNAGSPTREIEGLVAFLLDTPPSHGLKRTQVYACGGRERLAPPLKNLLTQYFRWSDADPFEVTQA
jgi:hypothetical protein